jgi:hypothetical protein
MSIVARIDAMYTQAAADPKRCPGHILLVTRCKEELGIWSLSDAYRLP